MATSTSALNSKITYLYGCFAKGDIPSILNSLHPQAEFMFCDAHYPNVSSNLPWAGCYKGVAGIGKFFENVNQYTDTRLTINSITQVTGKPNEALVMLTVDSIYKPNGRSGSFFSIEHWVFDSACDKVLRLSQYSDNEVNAKVLGIESPLVLQTRMLYDLFNKGDINGVLNMLDDQLELMVGDIHRGSGSLIPWAGSHKGKQNILRFFDILAQTAEFHVGIVNIAEGLGNTTLALLDIITKPKNGAIGGTYRSIMNWKWDPNTLKAIGHQETFDFSHVESLLGYANIGQTGAASAVIRSMYDSFAKGDINGILNRCSDNITFSVCDPNNPNKSSSIPMVGVWKGHNGLQNFFKLLGEKAELNLEVETMAEVGNKVIAVNNMHIKSKNSDNKGTLRSIHYWTLDNNMKAVDMQETYDVRYAETLFGPSSGEFAKKEMV
jgi:ketosteroid isomerase-like protein